MKTIDEIRQWVTTFEECRERHARKEYETYGERRRLEDMSSNLEAYEIAVSLLAEIDRQERKVKLIQKMMEE